MKAHLATLAATLVVAGCASMGMGAKGPSAVANLQPTKGNDAKGTVTFSQAGDVVHVSANISGLKPNATHGFHVHEKGDCSSGDGMSTGGHFNPAGKPHGPQSGEHHAGDMPSLNADSYGNANVSFDLHGVSIGSGSADLVGKGLIVHRDPDDYKTQPTGNAGPRIACAVIAKA
jgi:superoxide dismutase, Cu-Zn family